MRCERVDSIELLRSDLTPDEVRRCLEHMESCDDCRKRLSLAAALRAARPDTLTRLLRRWPIAAALLLSIFVAVAPPDQRPGSEDSASLATSERYPLIRLVTRSGDEDAVASARRAYEIGDCADLSRLALRSTRGGDLQFLAGVCHYLAGDLGSARGHLESALRAPSAWREPAVWYLANLELKAGRPRAARARLGWLQLHGGEFQLRARDLIRRLEAADD